jgi:hypothetical protein
LDLHILRDLGVISALLLAEAVEKRDVVAEHGVGGAGMLHGCIELTFDAGDGLEQELAEVAKGLAVWCEMRFSARAVKTLPRTWFMSVTVLSLPEREANSAASFSDSRRCSSSRA